MLTETQVKVILILLDDMGHSERSLAKHLEMNDSNLNPILKNLRKTGIIFRGEARKSTNKHKKEGEYAEFPYYITKDLNALKTIIKEIAESKKIYDTGFILQIVRESKYIDSMREKFGGEVSKSIGDELSKSYPPYTDSFIRNVIHPPLEKILCIRPSPEGLELWYDNYLRSLPEELQ